MEMEKTEPGERQGPNFTAWTEALGEKGRAGFQMYREGKMGTNGQQLSGLRRRCCVMG